MIKSDSRKIKPGDTFIAIKGIDIDGHDYINEAIKKGATKIICEHGEYEVETKHVKDTTLYLRQYLYDNYYNQIKDIKLIGVTGTSGKTTTSFLIYQILKLLNIKVGYIGTIGFYMDTKVSDLNNTTPSLETIYDLLIICKNSNIEYVVMEVSSHALALNRVDTLSFDAALFTNISSEHMDYHQTMTNYIKAKLKLFKLLKNNKIAIVNTDSKYSKKFILKNNNNFLINKKDGDIIIKEIKSSNHMLDFSFIYDNKLYQTSLNLVGSYNVYNYLMALLLVCQFGFNIESIIAINPYLVAPSGRMQLIKYHNNQIYIDYAHKIDAVINVYKNIKKSKKNKVITVIGCGGCRDKIKRPIIGNIATTKSNYVIFTNDNPRDENEYDIMKEIIAGVKKDNYEIIYDRAKAIQKGIDLLNNNDILLVLGKGHEDYQIIKGCKYHSSDYEIIIEYLKTKI